MTYKGTNLTRAEIDAAQTKYDMDLCELNEILDELGEKPTTHEELKRAGIVLNDTPVRTYDDLVTRYEARQAS